MYNSSGLLNIRVSMPLYSCALEGMLVSKNSTSPLIIHYVFLYSNTKKKKVSGSIGREKQGKLDNSSAVKAMSDKRFISY